MKHKRFHATLAITCRAYATEIIEAETPEQAIEKAKELPFDRYDFALDEPPNMEGDELVILSDYDATDAADASDEEVDRRDVGEPYSWEACDFVKRLANGEIAAPEGLVAAATALLKQG